VIFVTVGHQWPFDRLIACVDAWASTRPDVEVVAQIGASSLKPRSIRWFNSVSPDEFNSLVKQCQVIVGHAGMGTILAAMQYGKPIVVMPRSALLGEHLNDHQIATARRLGRRPGIAVAMDEDALPAMLDGLDDLRPGERISSHASPELLAAVRNFVLGDSLASGDTDGVGGTVLGGTSASRRLGCDASAR